MGTVIVGMTAVIIVALCLFLHYEVLRLLFRHSSKIEHVPRIGIALVFAALITTHLIEIWAFAFGYFLLNGSGDFGSIEGAVQNLLDYVYFSGETYATIGFGDMVPVGPLRFLAAMEALSGLFMIAWSASFLLGLMHDFWNEQSRSK